MALPFRTLASGAHDAEGCEGSSIDGCAETAMVRQLEPRRDVLRITRAILKVSGLVVALTPSPAVGQQPDDRTVTRRLAQSDSGTMVRLTFKHGGPPQKATLLGWTGDMLRLRGTGQMTDEIPLPNVSRIEMRAGFHRPFASYAFKGFAAGALLGALWGIFTYERMIVSHQQYALMGAFWAGSAGAVIGWAAAVGGQEIWRPVTIDGWSPPTAPP